MMRLMKMHKMAHHLDGKSGSERRQAMSKMANKMGPKAMKMFKKLSWMHQIMHETEDMDKKERKRTVKKLLLKKGKKGGKGKTWFDIMDTNKDGYVTMPEINQFYFDTDMNQNGSVTLNEWLMRFQYSEKMVCKRYESIIDDLIEAA